MIRHMVVFSLKHPKGSDAERAFLTAADVLGAIPGVQRFEKARQVGAKNSYSFCFSMEFADQDTYDGYNMHPDHVAFVRERWVPEVSDFVEIDTVPIGRKPMTRPRPGR